MPTSLERLLGTIPSVGVPAKANSTWLASIGFGGGDNQSMLRVLRNVGLIGQDGVPTETWKHFRGGDRVAIAGAVRAAYSQLYDIYPDAHQKDDEAITTFFRTHTSLADGPQRLCVRTFRALAKVGDFAASASGPPSHPTAAGAHIPRAASPVAPAAPAPVAPGSPLSLTVNIQLELPASADGAVYDKLFEAMAKHLRGLLTTG